MPEDAPLSFTVPANTFADQDVGDVLTLSASLADGSALPSWLSFDPLTQTFSRGTPTMAKSAHLALRVTATDPDNASVSDTFDLTVNNVNDAPDGRCAVGGSGRDERCPSSSSSSLRDTFADVDPGDTLAYSATLADNSPLPAWLRLHAVDPDVQRDAGHARTSGR